MSLLNVRAVVVVTARGCQTRTRRYLQQFRHFSIMAAKAAAATAAAAPQNTLPALPAVERLSDRVIRILGGNPSKFTLQGTNTYLLGTGPSRILIDTGGGEPAWRESLAAVLAEEHATVATALLTHWHLDHVSGVQDLRSLCPDVRVYKYPRRSSPSSSNVPSPPTPAAADDKTDRLGTAIISSGESDSIHDGQVFTVDGSITLTALHSPGHTTDHMAFQLAEEDGAWFTGDNVLGHGTAVFEDLATYMASLARMRDHCSTGTARGYPGHGAAIPNSRATIEEYIRHRGQREDEVLQVLAGGDGSSGSRGVNGKQGITPMQIVQVVYAAYPVSLHEPAEKGVVQVLEKLRGEGKVEKSEQGRWRLTTAEKPAL